MAFRFTGTGTYITMSGGISVSQNIVTSFWFKAYDNTQNHVISRYGDGNYHHASHVSGNVAGDKVVAYSRNVIAGSSAVTTTGFTTGKWHHGLTRHQHSTARHVWIDGGSYGFSSGARSVGTVTAMRIMLGGDIALYRLAIWYSMVPTASEIAALAAGADPQTIQPGLLRFYFPFDDDAEEVYGGLAGVSTINHVGTPTWEENPIFDSGKRRNVISLSNRFTQI